MLAPEHMALQPGHDFTELAGGRSGIKNITEK
jgi:hypothetical protein